MSFQSAVYNLGKQKPATEDRNKFGNGISRLVSTKTSKESSAIITNKTRNTGPESGAETVQGDIVTGLPILMHVDLDMYYAAVEIRNNAELNGKALVVGNPEGRETRRGVVLTASYEARKFGIRSGMSMHQALQLCPDVVISNSARKEYRPTSERVMEILKRLNVPMKITSIDEAYLELTEHIESYHEANLLAKEIQSMVEKQEKITISIGIGPTLKIAKMASDYKKPNGITTVSKSGLEAFFEDLPLKKIPGIGNKTAKSLEKRNIKFCNHLFPLSKSEILQLLGLNLGNFLYNVIHGKTSARIKPRGAQKSISHESTFHGKKSNPEKYFEITNKLFSRSLQTLNRKGYLAKTVNVKIRFNDFNTITRAKSIGIATEQKDTLHEITIDLLSPYFDDARGIRLLGVGFSQFEKKDLTQQSIGDFF